MYEVQMVDESSYAVYTESVCQLVNGKCQLVFFCSALNKAGLKPLNDWTELL